MTELFPQDSQNSDDLSQARYEDAPRESGYVKWFDEQKGYGFIKREGAQDVFVHFTHINRKPQTLEANERVTFKAVPGEKGPEARNVTVFKEAVG